MENRRRIHSLFWKAILNYGKEKSPCSFRNSKETAVARRTPNISPTGCYGVEKPFFPVKGKSTWWLGISNTWKRESLTRGKWCEKSLVAGTPPHLTAPLCLASSEWRTPSSPRPPRAHGQQRRRSQLLHWHLRARQPTRLMASELWTLKSFFHKLLILVMRPKEKSRAKEWPWRSVRHTALGTEPVPLQSSGAGGRRGWGRR